LEKVRKIYALSDPSRGTTIHEAEVATSKAKKLMDKYNIALGEVELAPEKGLDQITIDVVSEEAYGWVNMRDYQKLLGNVVARITYVESVLRTKAVQVQYAGKMNWTTKEFVVFIGDPTDVAVACEMYNILIKTLHTSVRLEIGPGYGKRQRSYCEGFTLALWEKANTPSPNNETLAMVVHSKADQIHDWMDENLNLKKVEPKKRRAKDDDYAKYLGWRKGTETDIGTKRRLK
jgi:hypothetical protein